MSRSTAWTQGVRWVRELLRAMAAEGRTIVVSSHLMSEMAQTADHLIVIGRGSLLADTPTDRFVPGRGRTCWSGRPGPGSSPACWPALGPPSPEDEAGSR